MEKLKALTLKILSVIGWLVAGIILFDLIIPLHETGHLLAALLLGMPVYSFDLWSNVVSEYNQTPFGEYFFSLNGSVLPVLFFTLLGLVSAHSRFGKIFAYANLYGAILCLLPQVDFESACCLDDLCQVSCFILYLGGALLIFYARYRARVPAKKLDSSSGGGSMDTRIIKEEGKR